MDSCLQHITTLSPKPGITIWYCKIPTILKSVFKPGQCPVLKPALNETFKKENFIQPVFSDGELLWINGFKALKKQVEWISGRYMIKQMLHHFFPGDATLDKITLSYQELGAPFWTNHPLVPISLSHSNDYTTVACSKNENQTIGIDIEKIAQKPDAFFLKTAFTQNEILYLEDDAAQIFKHWTIKEAYLKYIKKGFNESLHKVEAINNGIRHNNKKINVDIYSTFIDQDYVLSLVSD